VGMDYLTSFTIGGSWGSIAYSHCAHDVLPTRNRNHRIAGLVRNDIDPALRAGIKHVREKTATSEEIA
jgi:hypothetical protein